MEGDVRTEVKLNLEQGSLWDYWPVDHDKGVPLWAGTYRVVGVGRHIRTCQEMVIYVNSDKPAGQILLCPIEEFARSFRPKIKELPQPEKPQPEAPQLEGGGTP